MNNNLLAFVLGGILGNTTIMAVALLKLAWP